MPGFSACQLTSLSMEMFVFESALIICIAAEIASECGLRQMRECDTEKKDARKATDITVNGFIKQRMRNFIDTRFVDSR